MPFNMKKFDSWLKSRDVNLVEELSAEEMEKHGLDALKYAHSTVQRQRQEKEKMRAMQDLQKIMTSLESWVGEGDDAALRVKAIAAVLHLQDNEEDWVGDMTFGAMLPQSVVEGMAKIKDLDSMAKYFSHDNIVRHLGSSNALHDLTSLIKSDFRREIMPLLKKRPDIASDHGEMGRHFSEFVVSHITHAAKMMLQKIKSGEDKQPEEPSQADAEKAQAMQAAQMAQQQQQAQMAQQQAMQAQSQPDQEPNKPQSGIAPALGQ
jgi:hypothetical protein